MKIKLDIDMIENYIFQKFSEGQLSFIPYGATDLGICELSPLRAGRAHGYNYKFSLTYKYMEGKRKLKMVMKFYNDNYICQKEYRILKALKNASFSVPDIYLLEEDTLLFGAPFILMEKVEGETLNEYVKHLNKKNVFEIIERLAETLVILHNLKWEDMQLDFLNIPEDELDYAKGKALWEDNLPDYVENARACAREFSWVTNWLTNNSIKCSCNRYSLLHFDMNMKNFIVTKNKKIVVLDWEFAEIGDALSDVGDSYHDVRHMFGVRNIDRKGRETALHFLEHYIKKSGDKIDFFSLKFYLISSGLREAIVLRQRAQHAKNPLYVMRYLGLSYLPFFIFVCLNYTCRYKHLERFLREIYSTTITSTKF